MSFKDDLKRSLGFPQINVELDDKNGTAPDDFDLILGRTLRIIRTYFPCEYVIRVPVPISEDHSGGSIDLSKYGFMQVNACYVCKSKMGTGDVALPWSTIRIWEQVWLGKSDFIGTDLLLYSNELNLLNRVTNFRFSWTFDLHTNKLYVTSVPSFAIGIGVQGMKPIEDLNDIDDKHIVYEYALKYAIALGKQKLGHIWRKYRVEGMDMPGAEVVQEGKDEEEKAMTEIEANSFYPGGFHE